MTRRWSLRYVLLLAVAACNPFGPDAPETEDQAPDSPGDVTDAVRALPDAQVLQFSDDGIVQYMVGDLGHGPSAAIPTDVASAHAMIADTLTPALKAYRLANTDIVPTKMHADEMGNTHIRYQQVHNGLPVVGADLVVGIDTKGAIFSINGTARGDLFDGLGAHAISDAQALSAISHDSRYADLTTGTTREVYVATDDGKMHKALEAQVTGVRGKDPVSDLVYIDVDTGAIVADHPQIHFAENRKVYTANNGTNTPGTLVISEGGSSSDLDVMGAYNGTGDAYSMYKNFFNRDSFDNAGATLVSTVHYDQNYCNAYWNGGTAQNGGQMVYGDGDSSQGCSNLARAVDVTAHELTHAVTQYESNLTYSGESGGMNESNSDIFGATTEAWVNAGASGTNLAPNANTWIIGEEVIPPGLRWMNDPLKDGESPNFYSSTLKNLDVHYSSGVGNLAYYLAVNGGKNPRTQSGTLAQVTITGIGLEKAARIWYKANTDILTSSSNYKNWRAATEQAATQLGYDSATVKAVACAWNDVNVAATGTDNCTSGGGGGSGSGSGSGSGGGSGSGSGSGSGGGSGSGSGSGGGGGGGGVLTSGVAVSVPSEAKSTATYYTLDVPAGSTSVTFTISGGTGDADLYVKAGSKPTQTSYDCRPYKTGNNESCAITNPTAGTYYVMLYGYAAYSGVSLVGTVVGGGGGGGGGGGSTLQNGVPVTNLSGAKSSTQTWSFQHTGTATITISGSSSASNDSDLYVRNGSAPTTSTYDCRPYLTGSNESCTAASGTTYVVLRGYTAYSGVSLVASW